MQQEGRSEDRGPKSSILFDRELLQAERVHAGLTQEKLAEAADISLDSVRRAEREVPVSREIALAICAVLGVDKQELIVPNLTLEPMASLSRMITADMLETGGNWKPGAPFAFHSIFSLRSDRACELLGFSGKLYLERKPYELPEGFSFDDLPDEAEEAEKMLSKIPRKSVREYADIGPPIRTIPLHLTGLAPLPTTSEVRFVLFIGQDQIEFCEDQKLFQQPYFLNSMTPTRLTYVRTCRPGVRVQHGTSFGDEGPGAGKPAALAQELLPTDYNRAAKLECEIEFRRVGGEARRLVKYYQYSPSGILSDA